MKVAAERVMLNGVHLVFVVQSPPTQLCFSRQKVKKSNLLSPCASYQTGKASSETRVFLNVPLLQGANHVLPAAELKHLRARRIPDGARITVFNGTGTVAIGLLGSSGKVEVLQTRKDFPVQKHRLSAVIGLPKNPGRSDLIVEKLTELGTTSIRFSRTARVVATDPGEKRIARWQRLAISASKQSFRTDVPSVGFCSSFAEALHEINNNTIALLLSAGGEPLLGNELLDSIKKARDVIVIVGPEGGLDESEEELLVKAGARRIGLGLNRLRVETAAITAIAVLTQIAYSEELNHR